MEDQPETQITIANLSEIQVYKYTTAQAAVSQIRKEVMSEVCDVTTKKGREREKSLAATVASSKKHIERLAAESIEDARNKVKAVNSEIKEIVAEFDKLRDERKAASLEFEAAEEKRKAAISERIQHIKTQGEKLDGFNVDELNDLSNMAESLFNGFDFREFADVAIDVQIDALNKIGAAKTARIQYEADQAELAKLKAEKAERDAEDAKRAAEEAARKAEDERKAAELKAAQEAEERAKREAKEAEEREAQRKIDEADRTAKAVEAAKQAERDRIAKEQAEVEAKAAQIAAEAKARVDAAELAEAKRIADETHRKKVMRSATDGMMTEGPISEENARNIIHAIERGEIPHLKIIF